MQKTLHSKESDLENALAEVATLENRISIEEQKIFGDFNSKVGVKSVQEYEESRIRVAQQNSKRRVELNVLVSRLRSELESEKQRDLKKPLKFLAEKNDLESKKLKKLQKSIENQTQILEKTLKELRLSEENDEQLAKQISEQQDRLTKHELKSLEQSSKTSMLFFR
jgi:structural maintenance of chromosome 1